MVEREALGHVARGFLEGRIDGPGRTVPESAEPLACGREVAAARGLLDERPERVALLRGAQPEPQGLGELAAGAERLAGLLTGLAGPVGELGVGHRVGEQSLAGLGGGLVVSLREQLGDQRAPRLLVGPRGEQPCDAQPRLGHAPDTERLPPVLRDRRALERGDERPGRRRLVVVEPRRAGMAAVPGQATAAGHDDALPHRAEIPRARLWRLGPELDHSLATPEVPVPLDEVGVGVDALVGESMQRAAPRRTRRGSAR